MEIELPNLYLPDFLLSSAVQNYLDTNEEQYIQVWLNGEKEEPYRASYFARKYDEFPEVEQIAMSICHGKVLDIGAGAGAHSMYLTQKNFETNALEHDSGFYKILKRIPNLTAIQADFFSWHTTEKFDTILLLMNGFGIAGTTDRLSEMFSRLKTLLADNGKILAEITDYRFSPEYDHSIMANPEATFRLMYDGKFSKEFTWLYANLDLIKSHGITENLDVRIIYQEDETLLLEITNR